MVLLESVFFQRLLEVEGWGVAISFCYMEKQCSAGGRSSENNLLKIWSCKWLTPML